ncbi:MAG TPA: cupin-like domain-containing protein, partial [Rhizomicrobium sp.]|nr:cupin-like domain-containing protein [Rhizomicrobium sp.]
ASLGRREDGALDFFGIDNPEVQIKTAVLEPGDVLYLPARWWHRIELLSDSIGLGRKCLDEANLREHLRLRFAELMALALNHDEVKMTHPELYKVVIMRNRAWAKLMEIDLSRLRP